MGQIQRQRPALLMAAVFSQYDRGFDFFENRASEAWGSIALKGPRLDFTQTEFYNRQMGVGLRKQLYAFEPGFDLARLPACKVASNGWEEEVAAAENWDVERPVNIDPGYVTEAKLVLATTKDRDHRLYLGDGIFGEVTLHYRQGQWHSRPWTYPDYQLPEYHKFLDECRQRLRDYLKSDIG